VGGSPDNKAVARAAAEAFGGQPRVTRYWDDDRRRWVDVLECCGSPGPGVTSYGTIGLSDYPLMRDGEELGVYTELVGACHSDVPEFANCLSTAAFCVMNSGWLVAPGVIFPDVVAMYGVSATMKHLLFVPPFLWERLKTLDLGGKPVAWLLAVPISDGEMKLAETAGVAHLEELFEENQVDIFDIERLSVV